MLDKLDDIYTEFDHDLAKLKLDKAHKPLFWDLSPNFELTKNGFKNKDYIADDDGNLCEHDKNDYESRKADEHSRFSKLPLRNISRRKL
eukprot:UN04277